jgi:predicted  nucleic acid-binding Zn-ribbon protein
LDLQTPKPQKEQGALRIAILARDFTSILQFLSRGKNHLPCFASASIITTMNQAFHLYRLQQVDIQIDQVEAHLAEINRLLSGDEAIQQARQAVEKAEKTLHQCQQALKGSEFAVHEQQIKIAQSEASLYSGRIHNPKELQDIQKEIASLKKHLAGLEDRQLEAMMALEEAEEADKNAHGMLNQAQANFTEKTAGWLGQKDQLTRSLERLRAERAPTLPLVSKESLQVYEGMRKRKSGVAVTTIQENSCTVCGGEIRPSELQSARSAQNLVFCSSCGRILYTG